MSASDVRYWHKADIATVPNDVRLHRRSSERPVRGLNLIEPHDEGPRMSESGTKQTLPPC
jgi:hypothetical protein